jgi:glycosyltransferase involved in cell wall biosynthesis
MPGPEAAERPLSATARATAVEIVQIQRKPLATHFSIEGYFQRVRDHLPPDSGVRLFQLPCISRGLTGRLRNLYAAWRCRADIYHVTGDVHYIMAVLPRRRSVLTVHDCQVLDRLTGWRRAVVKWLWFTMPVRRAAALTVNSQTTADRLLQEVPVPADRIRVIPVSVSALFQPAPQPFNAECPVILQIGTKANKNLPRLIEALQGLRCRLHIVGPLDAGLKQQLHERGIDYRSFGPQSETEIVQRYCEADIISFVSTHEGFGMPIVEAQSIERVCVTSNCSSMPEIAGDGACLVDPYDTASIRAGFVRVLNDDRYREELIARGRLNKQRFDARQIALAFQQVYQSVSARMSRR